jgi:hypothetical protein
LGGKLDSNFDNLGNKLGLLNTGFSALNNQILGNSLAALGFKDTSTDPNGTPWNVGKILGDWTETYFKSIFGVAVVDGIKADWKNTAGFTKPPRK